MSWTHLWSQVLHWVGLHPQTAYLVVILTALGESLAIVGLLIPGTMMMIGIGALAGGGALSLKMTLLSAIVGAIAGDGLSYWIGHHYHQGIKKLWLFRKYEGLLSRGEEFLHRHGGKSIFLGRFVGPVRPIIPVVAGMLNMPPGYFFVVNVCSAVGWAVVYLLPGVLLGGSLVLVEAVSSRLLLLLLLLLLILWGGFWLCRKSADRLGKLGARGEHLLMPLLVVSLVASGWLFLGVLEDVVNLDPLVRADQSLFHFLQSLRTAWGDRLLIAVTEAGDGIMNLAMGLTVLLLLLYRRYARAALYWLAALAGGIGLVQWFKWLLHKPRPIDIYQGISAGSFPSGHATMSVVTLGFLAILLFHSFSRSRRWLPFAFAFAVSLLIAFSRLYLGAHWLSDILGGLSLGWAWAVLLGIFYLKKEPVPRLSPTGFILPLIVVMLGFGGWHIWTNHALDQQRYSAQAQVQSITLQDWLGDGWRMLPAWRIDLEGEREQPVTLQWAGDPEHLVSYLETKGWTRMTHFPVKSLLNIFLPAPTIEMLPLLPQLSGGLREGVLMVLNQPGQRLVLRLWPGNFRIDRDGTLWFGTITSQSARKTAGLLTLPHTNKNFSETRNDLEAELLAEFGLQRSDRSPKLVYDHGHWDGQVMLIWERGLSQKE